MRVLRAFCNVFFVLIFIPVWLYTYTFLHESGHAFVILYYGGVIESFSIGLNAYVISHSANFTPFGAALNNIAGLLLPAFFFILILCLYNPRFKPAWYHICYVIMMISMISSALVWVVVPILLSYITVPPDDVTNFIQNTGLHPLIVAYGGFFLILIYILLAYGFGLFRTIGKAIKYLRTDRNVSYILIMLIAFITFSSGIILLALLQRYVF